MKLSKKHWNRTAAFSVICLSILVVVGFLIPFRGTVNYAAPALIWNQEDKTALASASFELNGHIDHFLFRKDTISGMLKITPDSAFPELIIPLEKEPCLRFLDGRMLSFGYYENGAIKICNLWFGDDLQSFEVYSSAYGSNIRVTAPAYSMEDVNVIEKDIYLNHVFDSNASVNAYFYFNQNTGFVSAQ